ncbi:MAG TPA: hypothetical protein VMZ92_14650 [Planctomycetota bacterium]|nr:hypothetical protein [Planctomycetota bacterium]
MATSLRLKSSTAKRSPMRYFEGWVELVRAPGCGEPYYRFVSLPERDEPQAEIERLSEMLVGYLESLGLEPSRSEPGPTWLAQVVECPRDPELPTKQRARRSELADAWYWYCDSSLALASDPSDEDLLAVRLSDITSTIAPPLPGPTGLASEIEAILWLIRPIVRIPRPADVRQYLLRYPDLTSLLPRMSNRTWQVFRERAQLSLEVYRDPEIEDEYLALYVRQESYGPDIMDMIRAVLGAFHKDLAEKSGWILVTTDFAPPR